MGHTTIATANPSRFTCFDIDKSTGGCSEGLGAFRFSLNTMRTLAAPVVQLVTLKPSDTLGCEFETGIFPHKN